MSFFLKLVTVESLQEEGELSGVFCFVRKIKPANEKGIERKRASNINTRASERRVTCWWHHGSRCGRLRVARGIEILLGPAERSALDRERQPANDKNITTDTSVCAHRWTTRKEKTQNTRSLFHSLPSYPSSLGNISVISSQLSKYSYCYNIR